MRGQPNTRQDLTVAPLQRLDGAKRCAVFQSRGAQIFVIAVDLDRSSAPLPDMIELEWTGLSIPLRVFLARDAQHMRSPRIVASCADAGDAKLGYRIIEWREDRLHD